MQKQDVEKALIPPSTSLNKGLHEQDMEKVLIPPRTSFVNNEIFTVIYCGNHHS